jgi:plastocyanin
MIGSRRVGSRITSALAISCVVVACSGSSSEPASNATPAPPAAAAPASSGSSSHSLSGKAPKAVNGMPSIVVLAPETPREYPAPAEKSFMDQVTLTFTPAVLFVRTGQPTEFRNSDDVLHNVRVRDESTKEGIFNVAIPTGGTYQHAFPRDGFYDVGCDIHPGMSAQIIAMSTPYVAMADAEGNFLFDNVEPGPYLVTIYSGAEKIERKVDIAGPRTEVGL